MSHLTRRGNRGGFRVRSRGLSWCSIDRFRQGWSCGFRGLTTRMSSAYIRQPDQNRGDSEKGETETARKVTTHISRWGCADRGRQLRVQHQVRLAQRPLRTFVAIESSLNIERFLVTPYRRFESSADGSVIGSKRSLARSSTRCSFPSAGTRISRQEGGSRDSKEPGELEDLVLGERATRSGRPKW